MSNGELTCLVIVPLLDEAGYLPRFLASIDAQRRRPDRLILTDDGSTDSSLALCDAFAASRDWVTVVRRPRRPPTADRLKGAPEFVAFCEVLAAEDGGEDVLVKMDADLELAPRHVEAVLAAFSAEPRLGLAGTYLWARRADGTGYREEHHVKHVRGPTRFYRRECWADVSPLPAILGWDGADEVRARAHGWSTRSIDLRDPPSYHLRPTGEHDGRLRAFARWGECAYAVGAHPLGVLAGAALRAGRRPRGAGAVAYVVGWASAPVRSVPRFPADIRSATRREHLDRMRRRRQDVPAA